MRRHAGLGVYFSGASSSSSSSGAGMQSCLSGHIPVVPKLVDSGTSENTLDRSCDVPGYCLYAAVLRVAALLVLWRDFASMRQQRRPERNH